MPDLTIQPGDRVRSYDFEHREDCHIEGEVTDVDYELNGCKRYVIVADKRVFGGVEEPLEKAWFYPPMNGTPKLLGGVCEGVVKL